MLYMEFLDRLIDDAITSLRPPHDGEVDGLAVAFNICRGKSPLELWDKLAATRKAAQEAANTDREMYWRLRSHATAISRICYEVASIIWVDGSPIGRTRRVGKLSRAAQILGFGEVRPQA